MLDSFRKILNDKGEMYVRVKIRPNSSINLFRDTLQDGTVKIDIKAVPEKGKANKELIKFLSSELNIDKGKITIISGTTERLKLIKIVK